MKIAIVGAFDRYNYGDLLMPHIVKNELEYSFPNEKLEFDYYGLVKSNMEYCGGYNTRKLSEIYTKYYDAIILDGGDILNVTWSDMFLNLQDNILTIFFFKSLRKLSYKVSDIIAKEILNGKTYKPWILDKNKLKCKFLIYNTVDGNIKNEIIPKVCDCIKDIDYISVRNERVYNYIKEINSNCSLTPDSVINLSKVFDQLEIEKKVSKKIKDFVKEKNYYIFQCKKQIGDKYYNEIVNSIKKTNENINLKCLFLPIGFAQGHEDQIILKKLHNEISNTYFYDNLNIFEIIYLVKNSKVFVGTSLHGLITSISYGIPHMAFTNEIKKQIDFLDTWKTTSIVYTDASNMLENLQYIMKNYKQEVKKVEHQCKIMQTKVDDNFERIKEIIDKERQNG